MKSIEITVSGDVRNKGFRSFTTNVANSLGIKGFVRYNIDNEMFIAAEGEEESLDQLVGWCRNGFLSPSVSGIGINETTVKGYQSFDIMRDNEPDEPPGPRFSILNRAGRLVKTVRHFLSPTKTATQCCPRDFLIAC